MRRLVASLARRVPAGPIVVLYGPRGNGKTVLLHWIEEEAAAARVEAIQLHPSDLPNARALAAELTPRSWSDRLDSGELTSVQLAGTSWKPGDAAAPRAREILAARASNAPLVMLVDEAHTLDLDVGRTLLNAAQETGRRFPFLLALAGTPHLEAHLNRMGASFWSRAQQIRVGRLDPEAAAEAFQRPFESDGIRVDSAALTEMVRESQRYPYFVQVLGGEVWRQCAMSGRPEATPAALRAAVAEFHRIRGGYYRQRYNELKRQRLISVARTVAEAFRSRRTLDDSSLDSVIAAGITGNSLAVERAAELLAQLGYIWQLEDRPDWEPGIPSLMDYVREHAPRPTDTSGLKTIERQARS